MIPIKVLKYNIECEFLNYFEGFISNAYLQSLYTEFMLYIKW